MSYLIGETLILIYKIKRRRAPYRPKFRYLEPQRLYAALSHRLKQTPRNSQFTPEKDINVNFVRGRGRFETPSISLHYAATRLDTVLL
ncbi:hypothetical protein N7467_002842 [Penicillium canescens]|nr:hypothetical protein N7467_002842 [Penicillium canescens]